jgi:catechol 2,3-dioxygenase-like lactoylglutathione lyase family enzyme
MTKLVLDRLDHLVLTVRDIEATCAFYVNVLGMERRGFGEGRVALHFGHQKINLHPAGPPITPTIARAPTPGSADLCFLTSQAIEAVAAHLERCAVPIEAGPVDRVGAEGALCSLYIRDPDGNLIEIANSL